MNFTKSLKLCNLGFKPQFISRNRKKLHMDRQLRLYFRKCKFDVHKFWSVSTWSDGTAYLDGPFRIVSYNL